MQQVRLLTKHIVSVNFIFNPEMKYRKYSLFPVLTMMLQQLINIYLHDYNSLKEKKIFKCTFSRFLSVGIPLRSIK